MAWCLTTQQPIISNNVDSHLLPQMASLGHKVLKSTNPQSYIHLPTMAWMLRRFYWKRVYWTSSCIPQPRKCFALCPSTDDTWRIKYQSFRLYKILLIAWRSVLVSSGNSYIAKHVFLLCLFVHIARENCTSAVARVHFLRHDVLMSHDLNMLCSFGHSACLIESRCMVIDRAYSNHILSIWQVNFQVPVN